jgi:hypothetical protein
MRFKAKVKLEAFFHAGMIYKHFPLRRDVPSVTFEVTFSSMTGERQK